MNTRGSLTSEQSSQKLRPGKSAFRHIWRPVIFQDPGAGGILIRSIVVTITFVA